MQRSRGEDEQIAKPDSDGNRADISMLYARHLPELRRLVSGICGNGDLADDALQTAFARAVESGGPDKQESAKAWLFRVAVNEAISAKRRTKRENSHREQLGRHSAAGGAFLPDDSLIRGEVALRVRQLLSQLPRDEQQILRLRVYDDLKFREIAEMLRVPLGTVLTRARRALERLRNQLSDLELHE